jgi:hypothetical protein
LVLIYLLQEGLGVVGTVILHYFWGVTVVDLQGEGEERDREIEERGRKEERVRNSQV